VKKVSVGADEITVLSAKNQFKRIQIEMTQKSARNDTALSCSTKRKRSEASILDSLLWLGMTKKCSEEQERCLQ
jgi:hypothetical protein